MDVIVVDIDNTLLSQVRRKQKILEDVFGQTVTIQEIQEDFSLETVVRKISEVLSLNYVEAKKAFEYRFFSNQYYDETSLFDVIGNSNIILSDVCQKSSCEVLYLTSRNCNLVEQTLSLLSSQNYPFADEAHLIFAPQIQIEELQNYGAKSFESKKRAFQQIVKKYNVIAHIGDQASDAASSYAWGISSIVLSNNDSEVYSAVADYLNIDVDAIDSYGILCIDDWSDIGRYLLNRTGNSSSINDACRIHAENYASWMNDLDQKSSLILVVATFCASIFFTFLTRSGTSVSILILSILGFLFSLVSVFSAIRSFSSRITHGNESIVKVLWACFSKNSALKTFSPLVDRKKAAESNFPENLGAKYLYKRYHTFNEDGFVGKNMINLRAANYEKIYPEFLAKVCLFMTILILVLMGFLTVYPSLFAKTADQNSANKIISIANQQFEISQLYSFQSTDFDFDVFSLSDTGEMKIAPIVVAYTTQPFSELFVTIADKSEYPEFIQNGIDEIQIGIIYEALLKHGIEVKVVLLQNVTDQ